MKRITNRGLIDKKYLKTLSVLDIKQRKEFIKSDINRLNTLIEKNTKLIEIHKLNLNILDEILLEK